MKELTLEIKPKEGLGFLQFGINSEALTEVLGAAEDVEDLEDDDEFNTIILHYWDKGISAFFEGTENSVLSCFEIDNTEATLFGKNIFDMNQDDITELMKAQGYSDIETGEEEDGEFRLSFEDALIDFFFEEGELITINWGVLVNEQGEIEEF